MLGEKMWKVLQLSSSWLKSCRNADLCGLQDHVTRFSSPFPLSDLFMVIRGRPSCFISQIPALNYSHKVIFHFVVRLSYHSVCTAFRVGDLDVVFVPEL
jgi:hypothetical protein